MSAHLARSRAPHLAPDDVPASVAAFAVQQAATAESDAPCAHLLTGTTRSLCAGIRNDRQRCRGKPSGGHHFCSFHRQDLRETVRAGRVAGGRHREYDPASSAPDSLAELPLRFDSRGGVQAAIETIVRQLFLGKVSPAWVAGAARLFNVALRNLDHTDRELEDHTFEQYPAATATLAHMIELLAAEQAR